MYHTINAANIYVEYNGQMILDIDQLTIYSTDRIGLVGTNGCGKTTLLNILSGKTVCTNALVEHNGIIRTINQLNPVRICADIDTVCNTTEEYLSKLFMSGKTQEYLSGGEETRLQIAGVFRPDTAGIIADEPTSNLDQDGIQFLISELNHFQGMILIVSHDSAFLDETVNKIWELKNGTITEYYGNYSCYLLQKEAENAANQTAYTQYLAEKDHLRQIAETKRQQAYKMERSTKSQHKKNKSNFGGRLGHQTTLDTKQAKLTRKAKEAERKIQNMEVIAPPEKEHFIKFRKPKTLELHNPYPIVGNGIYKSFGELTLFTDAHFTIPLNSKVAITGANGCGKTTLFHMIAAMEPCIKISPKAMIGFYSQMVYTCQSTETVMEYLANLCDYNPAEIRAALVNMGFSTQDYRKKMNCLSGGELVKIKLLTLLLGRYNILLLDEPSNYLDTASVTALENMIKTYIGTVIFISHDRRLIENAADIIYTITDKKIVQIKP